MNLLAPWLCICAWAAIDTDLRDADVARDERIAALVRELGNDEYPRRQAASLELVDIGEPALPLLRKAEASSPDPEIRWRAAVAVRTVTERLRATATKKALEELQGTWTLVSYEVGGKQTGGEDQSYVLAFEEDKWSIHAGGRLFQGGTVTSIDVKQKPKAIDLAISEGDNLGATAISIYSVEGDTLKYINCGEPRATEFATKPGDGRYYSIFRRARIEP